MAAQRAGRHVVAVTLGGLVLGFASSIPIALILNLNDGVLPTISWRDPVPAVVVGLLLVTVAVLASLAPARRVLRLDPMLALRQE